MTINPDIFKIRENEALDLSNCPTRIKPYYSSKSDYRELLEKDTQELIAQQGKPNASGKYSLLLIFQAIDAAGKDGAIKHAMSGINPQACRVQSFKVPTCEELAHDFLWRAACQLPIRGEIGIFNRSYYEDVLIAKVHPEIVTKQNLQNSPDNNPNFWDERYESIRDFEKHLYRKGTRSIKFFLHVSKEEQRKRLLERIDT